MIEIRQDFFFKLEGTSVPHGCISWVYTFACDKGCECGTETWLLSNANVVHDISSPQVSHKVAAGDAACPLRKRALIPVQLLSITKKMMSNPALLSLQPPSGSLPVRGGGSRSCLVFRPQESHGVVRNGSAWQPLGPTPGQLVMDCQDFVHQDSVARSKVSCQLCQQNQALQTDEKISSKMLVSATAHWADLESSRSFGPSKKKYSWYCWQDC